MNDSELLLREIFDIPVIKRNSHLISKKIEDDNQYKGIKLKLDNIFSIVINVYSWTGTSTAIAYITIDDKTIVTMLMHGKWDNGPLVDMDWQDEVNSVLENKLKNVPREYTKLQKKISKMQDKLDKLREIK